MGWNQTGHIQWEAPGQPTSHYIYELLPPLICWVCRNDATNALCLAPWTSSHPCLLMNWSVIFVSVICRVFVFNLISIMICLYLSGFPKTISLGLDSKLILSWPSNYQVLCVCMICLAQSQMLSWIHLTLKKSSLILNTSWDPVSTHLTWSKGKRCVINSKCFGLLTLGWIVFFASVS